MSNFKLCPGDPLMKLLKDTFQATPVRIPEERFQPMIAVAKFGDDNKYLGRIEKLLTDPATYPAAPLVSQMANVSGTKTKEVNFELGFSLLSGFLKGMGMDGASLKASFSGVQKMSFSFQDVKRYYIEIADLGNFFAGKHLNKKNPASKDILEQEATCLIIDSVIVSNNFTINAEKLSGNDVRIDIPAIQQIVGKIAAGIKVNSSSSTAISFHGEKNLAFAFSSIVLNSDDDGNLSFGLRPELAPDDPTGDQFPSGVLRGSYLYPESVMLEF